MELAPATLVTAIIAIAGIGSTWGALSRRIRVLEDRADEIKTLRDQVAANDTKVEFVRTDQGRRLGDVEKTTNALVGRFEGFQSGFGAGRRSRTAAGGNKIGGE